MEKFDRIYSLSVEVDNGVNTSPLREEFKANKNVTITLPYTIEFEISRATLSSAQTGTFRIYNLGEDVRNAIQKDIFQSTQLRAIQFRAGYSNSSGHFLALVFNGTVSQAYSWREDQTWITEIEAYDGGFQIVNGNNISTTLSPGATARQNIAKLSSQLPNLSGAPIIGNFPATNKRGKVLFGNCWDLILQESEGLAFIDNGQVKALNYHEVIQGQLPLLSAETGLLGSPKRTKSTLEFDMMFEPRLTVGQLVRVDSVTNKQYNRDWKVMGFSHAGMISPSVGGEAKTSVKLWFTPEDLALIPGVPVV